MADRISLTGLRVMGTHGVLPTEKTQPQPFIIDISISLDTASAGSEDDLAMTVDYGALADKTREFVESTSYNLIETLANKIAAMVLDEPLVQMVEVTVHKPEAPIKGSFEDVAVSVSRQR